MRRPLRWLTGWITHPSPRIDVALVAAVVGVLLFLIVVAFELIDVGRGDVLLTHLRFRCSYCGSIKPTSW
jgi:hypothetical protein